MISSLALRIRILVRLARLPVFSDPQDQSNEDPGRRNAESPNLLPAMKFQRSENSKERREQELQQLNAARRDFWSHRFRGSAPSMARRPHSVGSPSATHSCKLRHLSSQT